MTWKFWKKSCANNSVEDDKQTSLTPVIITKESNEQQYKSVCNLARKLQEEDVLNIAVTGPYGSGKSSILRSLEKNFPKYKYLSISLATLKSPSDDPNMEIDADAMNNRIEYSILQQLIYKEKQGTLYNSRLKRIYHKSTWKQYGLATMILLYVVILIVMFQPSWLNTDWFCQSFDTLPTWISIIPLVILLTLTIIFTKMVIKLFGNRKLNKINLKDGEIGLQEDTSIFNKHMDEIIYFFQMTRYNVVCIEDLDRFNNTEIFLKLREVNQLLNQSKAIGRKIVFIYAVRDDIFLDEGRTKFFDYITTVIPIINSSNSADKLKEELENKGFEDIDAEVIDSLAFFIDDMRLLKNIVNEYAQYRGKLDKNLDQNKLLSMIVYKNYFPKDFADLHKGKGTLYECLHRKNELLVAYNKQIDKRIEEINKKLQCVEKTHTLQEKELRLVYIEGYREYLSKQWINNVISFLIEGDYKPLEEIADNEVLFNTFISQTDINYRYYDSYSRMVRNSLSIDFSQIENIVNPDFTYRERLEALRSNEDEYHEQIKTLELSCNNHYTIPVQELLKDIDMRTHPAFKGLHVSNMLESFLKEGLINEDYFDYISFFFGKSITQHDHNFILEVKLKHALPYNHPIDQVERCIKNIPAKCYNEPSILNIQVVDYICQHLNMNSNETKLHAITQTIKNNKKWNFLIEFYNAAENASPLFKQIANIVDGLWKVFAKINSDELYEAWLRFYELEYSTKESRLWIEQHYDFMSHRVEVIGIDTIKQMIANRKLVFTNINAKSKSLLEYIVEQKAYTLTPSNVACAFVHCRNERTEALHDYPLNLTVLKSCEPAKPILNYIYEHYDMALNEIFTTNAAKQESTDVIIEIINSETLKEDTKWKYLLGQHNKVSFRHINTTFWKMAIDLDIITPLWTEIYAFYKSTDNVINAKLCTFIAKHIDELGNIPNWDDRQKKQFAQSALLMSKFKISVYETLLKVFDGVTFEDADIDRLDDTHLKSLLYADMLPYSTYYTREIRDNHRDVLVDYINKYLCECIDDIEELPTDVELYKHIMQNPCITSKQALRVVKHYLPDIELDSETADITLPVLMGNIKEFDYEAEKIVLTNAASLQKRLAFLIDLIEKYKEDFDTITNLLALLGEPYRDIIDKSKKANLEKNDPNEQLLLKLQTVGYISSYSISKERLRVNHKRNH